MNSALSELQLINACIDSRDPYFFTKLGVSSDWFPTYKPAFEFITNHVRESGEVPTLSTVAAACKDVEFVEYESPDVVKKRLGDALAKKELAQWLSGVDGNGKPLKDKADVSKSFDKLRADIERKTEELEIKYGVRKLDGIDVMKSGHIVREEYENRKVGKLGVKIPTPFATLNDALGGGIECGDEAALIAFTNRGKTWIAALFGETANYHGFKVVHASLEMSVARVLFRWHSLRSYRTYGKGFSNRGLLAGHVEDEAKLYEYLRNFDADTTAPNYILKTRADYKRGVTLEAIERDIIENDLSGGMYILDQLNLCEYHSLPGGLKEFHRKLVGIFQRHNVVGLVMSQANGSSEKARKKDDDGTRILQAPDLTAYSETIAVIQDARTILTFDSLDNKALLSLEKATDGGVGTQIDLFWVPDYGQISEMTEAIERQLEAANATKLF